MAIWLILQDSIFLCLIIFYLALAGKLILKIDFVIYLLENKFND